MYPLFFYSEPDPPSKVSNRPFKKVSYSLEIGVGKRGWVGGGCRKWERGEKRGGCFLFLFVMTGWISDRLIDRGRDLPKHSPEDRLATTTQPEID